MKFVLIVNLQNQQFDMRLFTLFHLSSHANAWADKAERITTIFLSATTYARHLKTTNHRSLQQKIESKGVNVGLSFYAFFANKNNNPSLLMEAAEWWVVIHQLDHFEKATKIKKLVAEDS